MKIKGILTVFAFAIASISFAQSNKAMSVDNQIKKDATELTEEMTAYLDLSETQVQRMKSLNMMLMKRKVELNGMDLSDAERAEKLEEIENRNNNTIKQVLSEEQFAKFQKKYSEVEKMQEKE